MSFLAHLGPALRLLRESAGLKQFEAAERAGLAISVVNRAEGMKGNSTLPTIEALLDLYGKDLFDLAEAMADVAGGPAAPRGRARPEWVTALLRHGIESRTLIGLAISVVESPEGEADLYESARVAAEHLVEAVIEETTLAVAQLAAVAEPEAVYGQPAATDRVPPARRRKRSPR